MQFRPQPLANECECVVLERDGGMARAIAWCFSARLCNENDDWPSKAGCISTCELVVMQSEVGKRLRVCGIVL